MADAVAAEHSCSEMISIASFAAVWTKKEGIETALLSPDVQRRYVCEEVVHPVAVRRILFVRPFMWEGELLKDTPLYFALIVDTVESDDPLKEDVELWVAARVFSHLKQRLEDVDDNLLEVVHEASGLVYIIQTRDLNEPAHVR
jgi:hypothetical protein